jgi:hypothetical protein
MYAVKLEYQHRTNGPQGRTIDVDTGSMAAAIGKAAREFLKGLIAKNGSTRTGTVWPSVVTASRKKSIPETRSEKHSTQKPDRLERESAFAKKPRAHLFVQGQIGTAKNVIRNACGILGDQWHGSCPQRCCFR